VLQASLFARGSISAKLYWMHRSRRFDPAHPHPWI